MFKINNKDTETFWCLTANFEHVSHHYRVTRLIIFTLKYSPKPWPFLSLFTLQERARELQDALYNVNEKENQDPSRQRMTSWVVDFSNDNDDQQDTQGMSYCGNLFSLKIWEYCNPKNTFFLLLD